MKRLDTEKWADFWCVSRRAVQGWVKKGHPVDRPLAMADLILSWKSGSPAARSKALALAAESQGLLGGSETLEDCDNIAASTPAMDVVRTPKVGEVGADGGGSDLESTANWCNRMMRRSADMQPPDTVSLNFYHDKLLKTRREIRDAEAHSRKMGLDEGAIINREEFERLLFAIAFWMMRGVDVDIDALAPKLKGLDFVGEIRMALDRFFVRSRFFSAFSKSITQESGLSLPVWAYKILEESVNVFWEVDMSDKDDVAAQEAFDAALKFRLEGAAKSV